MKKLLARYREWRKHGEDNGEGPIIWWPHERFRVYIAPESWSLPLAIHWEDEGEYARTYRTRGITLGFLCLSCFIDLTDYRRVK